MTAILTETIHDLVRKLDKSSWQAFDEGCDRLVEDLLEGDPSSLYGVFDPLDPGKAEHPDVPRSRFYIFARETPDPTLHDNILMDPDPIARIALAKNPHVRHELLQHLMMDPEPEVQRAAHIELTRRTKDQGYNYKSVTLTGVPRPDFLQIGKKPAPADQPGPRIDDPYTALIRTSSVDDVRKYMYYSGLWFGANSANMMMHAGVAIENYATKNAQDYLNTRKMLERTSQPFKVQEIDRNLGARTWKSAKGQSITREKGKSILTTYEMGFTVVERDKDGFLETRYAIFQSYPKPPDSSQVPTQLEKHQHDSIQALESANGVPPGHLYGLRTIFRAGGCDGMKKFAYLNKTSDPTTFTAALNEIAKGGPRQGVAPTSFVMEGRGTTIAITPYRNGFVVKHGGDFLVWQP